MAGQRWGWPAIERVRSSANPRAFRQFGGSDYDYAYAVASRWTGLYLVGELEGAKSENAFVARLR